MKQSILVDGKDLDVMSSDDLATLLCEKQKELNGSRTALSTMEVEFLGLRRQMAELRLKMLDLEPTMEKAKTLTRNLATTIKIIERKMWDARGK